ncbi:MAG: glutathione S-transferase N-terminal domain-containing protein [Gammaproteobacteria bacterium]
MLKLYHAEPVANSMKVLIPLHEKGLEFERPWQARTRPTRNRAPSPARRVDLWLAVRGSWLVAGGSRLVT